MYTRPRDALLLRSVAVGRMFPWITAREAKAMAKSTIKHSGPSYHEYHQRVEITEWDGLCGDCNDFTPPEPAKD